MKSNHYQDSLILHEVACNSHLTQRDLAKRLGLALGLINLRLQRLSRAGHLRLAEMGYNRTQYLITPKGLLEKERLLSESLGESMKQYRTVRGFLKDPVVLHEGDEEKFAGTESAAFPHENRPAEGTAPDPGATDVVILCGGKGTRLKSLTASVPKPLLPVAGEPFLLRLLLRLKEEGFRRFILAAHYLPQQFREFVEANRGRFEEILLVVEPQALGTGGALRHAVEYVASPTFLVLNGDSWVDQPLQPVLQEHGRLRRDFTVIAVPAPRVEGEALKKGVWRIGPGGEVLGFDTQESVEEGWVNAGCYYLSREMVGSWPVGSYSFETNLPVLLGSRRAGVYCSQGRLLDIGTPQTYGRAGEVLESFSSAEARETSGGPRR